MDRFDTAILNVLQEDAQTPFTELGEKVGLSPSACHKRVKEMWRTGVITQEVVLVDERAAGLETSVFVQATLKNQQQATLAAFEEAAARRREIMECYLMAGLSDYLLRILCRDGADYERIHTQILTRLPGVDRVITNFAIRKVIRRTAVPL
ncbi:Lrp/AsnC family transcriptional regulator [Hyphococcus luteus]|uniref:AsnC family transcriptional regulator n=1 Tax=Hyphococcus luteus TaxID=2058213 RepID=A0A2S7JZD2_9PROT|nr:Lrp/AsnC family transcriptional regulator [Marinicaulis flavus]PQA85621.1 AsnC family transcriptional regulator [Marinicaulis flavus]